MAKTSLSYGVLHTLEYNHMVQSPAWKKMRGMDVSPEDPYLPDGTIIRGNRIERNIFYYPEQPDSVYVKTSSFNLQYRTIMMSNWLRPLMATAMATIVLGLAPSGWTAEYFVDAAAGRDDNSGLLPAEAWQSIERVNQARLNAGDTVRLKAGSVWRESLLCQSGVEGQPVTYTSYGDGPKPTLLASVDLCSPDAWVPDGGNFWKTREDRITGRQPIPSFASGDWSLYCDGKGEAAMTVGTDDRKGKVYTLRCQNSGERPTNIQLNSVGVALEPGQYICFRFRAKATHPFRVTDISLIQANYPWGSYGVLCRHATDITTEWQDHEVVFRTTFGKGERKDAIFDL